MWNLIYAGSANFDVTECPQQYSGVHGCLAKKCFLSLPQCVRDKSESLTKTVVSTRVQPSTRLSEGLPSRHCFIYSYSTAAVLPLPFRWFTTCPFWASFCSSSWILSTDASLYSLKAMPMSLRSFSSRLISPFAVFN